MNRISLRIFLLVLMAICWQLLPDLAHAATGNVTCTSTVTPVNFGTVSPTATATDTATGSIQFTCTNVALIAVQDVTLCLGLEKGGGTSITPTRQMNTSPAVSPLQFQVYKDTATTQIWGNVPSTANPAPQMLQFTVGLSLLGLPATYNSPPYTVYGSITTPQSGVLSGSYSNTLNGSLTYQANNALLGFPATCDGGTSDAFALPVQASVPVQCTVSADTPLILGSASGVTAGTANSTGSTSFGVTCTSGAPYTIGLAPNSVTGTTGAGLMSGTGGNTNKVPYQLNKTSATGPVWGNTASSPTIAGNGIAGTGNGMAQQYQVYATAPSSDFKPDTYSDTVMINVNY